MGLPGVTVAGAIAKNKVLFTKQQSKLAAATLSSTINRSAVNPNAAMPPAAMATPMADTVSAGLTISLGGIDTLGTGPKTIQFQSTPHRWPNAGHGLLADTLVGAAGFGNAALGNQTLLGGATDHTPPALVETAIATVFGAAMAGNAVGLDLSPRAQPVPHEMAPSVAGAAPDLLVGWSVGQSGYTLDLGTPRGPAGHAHGQADEHAEIRMATLPRDGAIEIIFHKPS